MTDKFFKFTKETAEVLRKANLSKKARILWDYLITKNPFGKKEEPLIFEEIERELKWQKHTFYRAKAELLEKNLFIFTDKNSTFRSTLTETVTAVAETVTDLQKQSQIYENCKTIDRNRQNQEPDPLPNNDSNISKINKNIKIDLDHQEGEEKNMNEFLNKETTTNNGTQNQESKSPLDDPKFIEYAQRKYPNVESIMNYLKTPDKVTGSPIYEKLYAVYQGKTPNQSQSHNCDRYWKEKLPYSEMKWSEELPCYSQWLTRTKNLKSDATFIEDTSLGYHRNLRITFIRWYENYYQLQADNQTIDAEVNPQALNLVSSFLNSWKAT